MGCGGVPRGKHLSSPIRSRSPAYRKALAAFEQVPGWLQLVGDGSMVGNWRVLHPAAGEDWTRADDAALVLAATICGQQVVLLADLGRSGQEALLQRHPDLKADVVITALPSSGEPVCDALLDQLQPELVIVADADFPASERAPERLRERLAKRSFPVLYTRVTGALTLRFTSRACVIRSVTGSKVWQRPQGRSGLTAKPQL